MADKKDYAVELNTRFVIQRKLLAALTDKDKVAILATEEDLKILIHACKTCKALQGVRNEGLDELRRGMEELLLQAFRIKV